MDALRGVMHRMTVTVVSSMKDSGFLHWYITETPVTNVFASCLKCSCVLEGPPQKGDSDDCHCYALTLLCVKALK